MVEPEDEDGPAPVSGLPPVSDELAAPSIFAEDLRVGDTHRTSESEFSEEGIRAFASAWDPLWFHTDEERAAHGPFGGVIASGIHSLALLQRLLATEVYKDWHIYAGRQIGSVRFHVPVRPGTVAWAELTVRDIAPRQSGYWLVTCEAVLASSRGPLVSAEIEQYIWSREAERFTSGR